MPIVWDDKARARVAPRRRESVSPPKTVKPATVWAAIRKNLGVRGRYDPIEGTYVKGRNQSPPENAALMEKCEPIARSEEPPIIDDQEVAAAFLALTSKVSHGHPMAFLLATKSLPFAFGALLRSRDFEVAPRYVNGNDPFKLLTAPADSPVVDTEWRSTLLAAPEEVRAECKQIAMSFLARAPNLGQRTTIAYAFFEEPLGDDVCRAWIAKGINRAVPLNALVRDFELAKTIVKNKDSSWNYFDLIETFGEAMLPVIIELAQAPFDRYHSRDLAEAVSLFDDPAAAAAMLKMVDLAPSRPFALTYFGKFPHHAEAALASIATMKGRGAKIAREVLAGAQRALDAAVPAADEASPEEMPRVLAQPPWLDEKKPRKPVTKLGLARLDLPESVDWQPGEKEKALKHFARTDKPASAETLADFAKVRAEGKFVNVIAHKNEMLPDDVVLEAWNAGQKTYGGTLAQKVQYIFSKYGDAAWPGLEYFVGHLVNGWGDASFLLRVASWRLALPFAANVAHRRIGKLAWQWLQRHAELAVLALVPVAFGDTDERAHAERGLFRLKASGVDVIGIGARYGKEAKAALEKLFSWDPLYDLPKTIPKLGASWRPETLTRPRLLEGKKPLPLSALDTIATMLAMSPLDPPYAGIVHVQNACDPRSLVEFSWDATRAWEHAGHKKKDIWMLNSLVHFADDEVVRRLTPGVRVDFAVHVLEVIGTDAALMELATIAGRTQSQGNEWTLGGRIEKLLDAAAEARGLTKDELEEDLAPTTMLDEAGMLVLDYGSRKIHVGFDESLEPYVKNEAGNRSRAVPPMRKDDDPAAVEHAKTIWRDLKEDVVVIAARRIKALERAMSIDRRWTRERFDRVWVEHRLMKHMARGVIWTDGKTAFRLAEDGSFSNVDDAPHALAPDAKVGVAHPLKMSKDEIQRWCTILEDYKIVQPFSQVGRRYLDLVPTATRMSWPYGPITIGDLTTRLSLRGFSRGPWAQGKYNYLRSLGPTGHVHVEFKNDKSNASEIEILFMRDGTESPASTFDATALADAIYELQS